MFHNNLASRNRFNRRASNYCCRPRRYGCRNGSRRLLRAMRERLRPTEKDPGVPEQGPGSAQAMAGEPVATAAGGADHVPPRPVRLSTGLTARARTLANQLTTTPDAASPGQQAGKILEYHLVCQR
jgi:hypothetical protein